MIGAPPFRFSDEMPSVVNIDGVERSSTRRSCARSVLAPLATSRNTLPARASAAPLPERRRSERWSRRARTRKSLVHSAPISRLLQPSNLVSGMGGKRLFDDLVGAGENRGRHGKPERLGGLQIDDQLKFGRLLDR
jgi:hypothetical protein